MKKLLFVIATLFITFSYSQEDIFGNSPVKEVTPIKRVDFQKNSDNLNRTVTSKNNVVSSVPTGSSTEVGVTEGQLSVSLTGGANYNIPIVVPPGINGVIPEVSLSYNSQGGNGLAGYGWNISGVSSITRIPSTKFHDNTIDGVDFNSLDRFALDGQRLMIKNNSGNYGANGTLYETESFSNVQITSYGVHPSGANYGPEYFVVQYPDGSIAHYGNSTTSRSLTEWGITYWQNPQGIRINYNYIFSDNNLSISTITYGSRLATTPINEISFVYKTRQRPEQAYVNGQSFIKNTILSEINVKGNNIGFRNYVLGHETTSLGYERLKSITEKSGDNTKSFNPTVFYYETTDNTNIFNLNSLISVSLNQINFVGTGMLNGDFDGDGSMDFILYPTVGSDTKKKYWLFSNINGNTTNIGTEHNLGSFTEIFPTFWLSGNNKLMPMQGWCAIQTNTTTNITTFNNYSTGIVNSIYFQYSKAYEFPKFEFSYWHEPCNDPLNPDPEITDPEGNPIDPGVFTEISKDIPKEYLSGDFNGDGLTDVIVVEKKTIIQYEENCTIYSHVYNGGKTYFLDLDRRLVNNYINDSGDIQITENSKFIVADVNGDGKSEIMVFDSGNVKTYFLNDNKQLVQIINFSDGSIISEMPRYFGDFNGDGKSDFVIPQADNIDSWSFFISKGNSFQKTTTGIGRPYKTSRLEWVGYPLSNQYLVEYNYIPSDFNNDGKTDILFQENFTLQNSGDLYHGYTFSHDSNPASTKFILLENKIFNGSQIVFNIVNTPAQDVGVSRYPIPLFLNNVNSYINRDFEYGLLSGNSIRTFKITKDSQKDLRLTEIVLGNGIKEVITYQNLDNNSNENVYEPSLFVENYPNFDLKVSNSFRVVSKLEHVSATQYKQQKFKYYGAVSNVEGLGFFGFRGLARTNWFNEDNSAISTVTKHDITKRGAVNETFTVLGEVIGNFASYSPTDFINKTNMSYTSQLLGNKVYKINNTNTISQNGLDGTSKEATTNYDLYNNPLTTTTLSKNGTSTEKTEVVNIDYFPITTSPSYIIGRIKKNNSSISHNGDTMTSEEIYTYNTDNLLSQVEKRGHLTNYLIENNLYDAFGNITQKKITAVGLTPRTANFTYDTSGRFLLSSINVEGLATTYIYNNANGLLLSETLPSNAGYPLTTSYLYDAWGKKIKETNYLGKSLNYSCSWLSAGNNGFFATSTTGDDDSATFEWYDDLGRKIAEGFRTINDSNSSESNNSWKTFEYDIYDRVEKSYEPQLTLFPQWSGLYNTTTFDVYGRPTEITEFTGKVNTFEYSGLITTGSDGVNINTITKNSIGNIVSKTDNGGTITYQYFANGNLKSSNFGGVVVEVEQDGWGRKKKLTDPSAGVYEYEYNEFGEIKKETSPKGITNYTIDDFGKVTEKTIVGINGDTTNNKTVFTYNSGTKLLTNTRYDDFTGGFYDEYAYDYDNYRRLYVATENKFGNFYQRVTLFDDFGRPVYESYNIIAANKQSAKAVRNSYKNGHHWQILDNDTNQVLWQTSKVNAKGQFLTGNYGNGINITNTYNQYGFPTEFKHNKTVSSSLVDVMTLNTSFDSQRGNLLSRYNSLFNYDEVFTYDDLDRLTGWTDRLNIINCNFSSNNEGFAKTNSNVTMTHQLMQGRLYVSSNIVNEGVKKVLYSNSSLGTNIEVKGLLTLHNASLGSVVKISILEKDVSTGQVVEIVKPYTLSSNVFTINHTVNQFNEVSIKFSLSNIDPSGGPSIAFYLDNIIISNIGVYNQTYDSLGRIDDNNVGSYNYTNVNSVTSVPKHFQNSSIDTNAEYQNYYLSRANLDITYNAFKSPIDIVELGKDKLSFTYNMNNGRSSMLYGSMDDNKYLRPFRKYYSLDGSMEVKENIVNGTVEFITYIGGDAYTAPVILKSDGTTQQYMYLHRDYLGSILAITNQSGNIVEKRMFDAWGNISKVQDGAGNNLSVLTVIDRGYTGHEHLQGVNLIHMNARLYDPVIHRFLQPDNFIQDPYNTQNFNRYSYGLNNPFKYTDSSGEFWFVVAGAVIGGYLGASVQQGTFNIGKWDSTWWKGAVVGAIIGAYGGQQLALALNPSMGLSSSGFSGVLQTGIKKGTMKMLQKYVSSIPSFSWDDGIDLNFSLSDEKFDKLWLTGASTVIGNITSTYIYNKIYDKGKDGKITSLFKSIELSKATKNLVSNSVGSMISNTLNNKPTFKNLTLLSLGNGFMKITTGVVVQFNWSKLIDHGLGWNDHLMFGTPTPKFDLFGGANFEYKKSLFRNTKSLVNNINEENRDVFSLSGSILGAIVGGYQVGVKNNFSIGSIFSGAFVGGLMGNILVNSGMDFYLMNNKK